MLSMTDPLHRVSDSANRRGMAQAATRCIGTRHWCARPPPPCGAGLAPGSPEEATGSLLHNHPTAGAAEAEVVLAQAEQAHTTEAHVLEAARPVHRALAAPA